MRGGTSVRSPVWQKRTNDAWIPVRTRRERGGLDWDSLMVWRVASVSLRLRRNFVKFDAISVVEKRRRLKRTRTIRHSKIRNEEA